MKHYAQYRIAKGFPGAGRFVKASTWRRSKAQGGTKYKRRYVTPKRKQASDKRGALEKFYETFDEDEEIEYIATPGFASKERGKK